MLHMSKNAKKAVTKVVDLSPAVVGKLDTLAQQMQALNETKALILGTVMEQAGIAGQVKIVGFDAETRKLTVHVS